MRHAFQISKQELAGLNIAVQFAKQNLTRIPAHIPRHYTALFLKDADAWIGRAIPFLEELPPCSGT